MEQQNIGGKRVLVAANAEVQLSSAHKRKFFECVELQSGTPYVNDATYPRIVIVLGGGKTIVQNGRFLQFPYSQCDLGEVVGVVCSITPIRIPESWEGEIWAVNSDPLNDSYIHYIEY
jgi:hypothetical protein